MVLLLWIVGILILVGVNRGVGTAYNNSFNLPGTDSTKALNLLKSAFPSKSGESDTVVWHVNNGTVRDPGVAQDINGMLGRVAKAPSVSAVASAYAPTGGAQISKDGRTAYATITWDKLANDLSKDDVRRLVSIADSARSTGQEAVQVEVGGAAVQNLDESSGSSSEVVGVIAAAVVLFIAFGSLLATVLPLLAAVLSLVAGTMIIGIASNGLNINPISPEVAALIGLGVGIDYALFIVTRHRSGLRNGMSVQESTVRALNTAGRAVIFAGATVCIAMLGLLVCGVSFLNGIGIASAIVVVLSVFASATLLPAMLGFLGHRVLSRRERRVLAEQGPRDVHLTGFWARWSRLNQRNRWVFAPIAVVILAALAIPLFSIHLGSSDEGNNPTDTTTRKAYDLLADGFGPGFNGPLQLVAQVNSPADRQALAGLADTARRTPGVAAVAAPPIAAGATVGTLLVFPTTSPQDTRTSDLINQMRDDIVPAAERGTTLKVYVGGQTAIFDDFASVLGHKMPIFIGVIIGLGFILLLFAFRSLVVPLTAAVMNLLAAGASFGVVVAFFQWGWGSTGLGLGKSGPIESWLPVMMLAILFGLSMDYQVFLVSRMHEEWVTHRDNGRAVRVGQAATGRVITAAATIMICVFLAFVLGGQRVIAEFGIGLSGAVFIDAFILRTVLVPALMHMFGRANWWLPGWLDRILPHLSVEPSDEPGPELIEVPRPQPANMN